MYKAIEKIILSNSMEEIEKIYKNEIYGKDINMKDLEKYFQNKVNEEKVVILAIINNEKLGEKFKEIIINTNYIFSNKYGFNIFHYIGLVNNKWILSYLKKSEKINEKNIYDIPPICFCKNKELLDQMIKIGGDINIMEFSNHSLIFSKLTKETNGELNLLLEKGGNPNFQDKDGNTPLMYAIENDNLKGVEILLHHGANMNIKNIEQDTPLNLAVRYGNLEIVEKLFEFGAKDLFGRLGNTALMEACHYGEYNIAEYLIKNKLYLNIDAVNNEGFTALMKAIEDNQLEIVNLLLENNANVLVEDDQKWNATSWALSNCILNENKRSFEILKRVINQNILGIYINDHNRKEESMEALAFSYNAYENIDEFYSITNKLKSMIEQDKKFENIIKLIESDNLDLLKEKIKNGLDINIKGVGNRNLLMIAMNFNKPEICKFLIENGIEINLKNYMNIDILTMTSYVDDMSIFERLIELGLDKSTINNLNNNCWGAMHFAVENENIPYMKEALKLGANINMRTNNGKTPLYLACSNNKIEIVKFLIENGADINIPDNEGDTPFKISLEFSSSEISEFLIESGATFKDMSNVELQVLCIKNKKEYLLDKINFIKMRELNQKYKF